MNTKELSYLKNLVRIRKIFTNGEYLIVRIDQKIVIKSVIKLTKVRIKMVQCK